MLRRDVTAQAESTIDGVYHQRASRCLDGAEKCRHTPRENFVEFTRIAAVATALHAHAYAIAGDQAAHLRWRQKNALGEAFDLTSVRTAMAVDIAEVHRFIDPSLRRVTATWDDIGVPDRLRELADAEAAIIDRGDPVARMHS